MGRMVDKGHSSARWNIAPCCLCAVASSVLLWLAYPPVGCAWIVFAALSPLLAISRFTTLSRAAATWTLAGLLFWFANFSGFTVLRDHGVEWTFVLLGLVVGPLLRTLFFALFGFLSAYMWRRVNRNPSFRIRMCAILLAEPFLWAGCEWLRVSLSLGMEGVHLGTAVCQIPGIAWPARLGGEFLLSAIAVLANGAIVSLVFAMAQKRLSCRAIEIALPCVLVAILAIAARPCVDGRQLTKQMRVVLVQRNAPLKSRIEKMLNDGFDPYGQYATLLSGVAGEPADLVVLPESAMDEFGSDIRGTEAWKAMKFISQKTKTPAIMAGGQSKTPAPHGRYIQTAAALYAFPREGDDLEPQVYIKRELLPFGECNPLAKWIPALRDASYFVESPGTEVGLFEHNGFRVAPLVCFDGFVSQPARESAAAGAQALVLISNDLWYAPSSLPMLHFWQAVARSVETGLPLVSAGNVGVTGVVRPDGFVRYLENRATGKPLMAEAGVMRETIDVSLLPVRTLYTRFGDLPLLCLAALAFGFAVTVNFKGKETGRV